MVGNNAVNWIDVLGLEPSATPRGVTCQIRIEVTHALQHCPPTELRRDVNWMYPEYRRWAAVGCFSGTDLLNDHWHNQTGAGVPGIPRAGEGRVGNTRGTMDFGAPWGEDRAPANGGYGDGEEGFDAFMWATHAAAKKTAEELCKNPKKCCKEVKIQFYSKLSDEDFEAAVGESNMHWKNLSEVVPCNTE